MQPNKSWLLALTLIVCITLALTGAFYYPLSNEGLLEIIAYELTVSFGAFGILLLIHKRGSDETALE
ncbi:MAG: hypothetical protein ACW97A_13625 [Candidatus Thorarchaeota archaeon]